MRCVIIEDEVNSQELLSAIITEFCPDVKIVGNARSIEASIELLNRVPCDVVFSDVELLDGKSFDIFDALSRQDFQLVFTTAYDHFAFKAFKLEAVDYLLKPYSPSEVVRAVSKVRAKLQATKSGVVLQYLKAQKNQYRLSLHSKNGVDIVDQKDVIYCSADGAYCKVVTTAGQHMVSKTLGEIEDSLDPAKFVRIHASHLINLSYLQRYIKTDGGSVVLKDGTTLPLSRRRKQEFLDRLPI